VHLLAPLEKFNTVNSLHCRDINCYIKNQFISTTTTTTTMARQPDIGPWPAARFDTSKVLCGEVVSPPPNTQRGGPGYPFLSGWVITFGLSDMGGATSS
jgi:hypothetical protein